MDTTQTPEEITRLVDGLHFAEKVERSLQLINETYEKYGHGMVIANSLGKDSVAVWHLAKRVSPDIRGFIVTTRYKPPETVQFMNEQVARYPELKVFRNDAPQRVRPRVVFLSREAWPRIWLRPNVQISCTTLNCYAANIDWASSWATTRFPGLRARTTL